jgi:anti-sigma factor RsiW
MDPSDDDREQLAFLLSRYLDGDLDEAPRSELQRRLEQDPELAATLEQFRRTDQLIRAWAGPAPELDVERFVEEAAQRRRVQDAWHRRQQMLRLYLPLSAAAAILLAVTLYVSLRAVPQVAPRPQALAVVSIHRADSWRRAPGLGEASAEVRFDRTPPAAGTDAAPAGPQAAVAIAAAGAGPPGGSVQEDAPPYF